jgi:hypothetical protein
MAKNCKQTPYRFTSVHELCHVMIFNELRQDHGTGKRKV